MNDEKEGQNHSREPRASDDALVAVINALWFAFADPMRIPEADGPTALTPQFVSFITRLEELGYTIVRDAHDTSHLRIIAERPGPHDPPKRNRLGKWEDL